MTTLLDQRVGVPDRFSVPLYTVVEAARYLDVPPSTLTGWARGYRKHALGRRDIVSGPLLTTLPQPGYRGPAIPFIGLAEGLVLTALRRSDISMQRIRPALAELSARFGVAHALASRHLYTDGAEVLYDFAARSTEPEAARAARELVVLRNGQRVFIEIVEQYLRRIEFGDDNYPLMIRLPAYEFAEVVVDPARGFGQPIFARGGAKLEDALGMFRAGEPIDVVAAEYGVPPEQLEDAVRVAVTPIA